MDPTPPDRVQNGFPWTPRGAGFVSRHPEIQSVCRVIYIRPASIRTVAGTVSGTVIDVSGGPFWGRGLSESPPWHGVFHGACFARRDTFRPIGLIAE